MRRSHSKPDSPALCFTDEEIATYTKALLGCNCAPEIVERNVAVLKDFRSSVKQWRE